MRVALATQNNHLGRRKRTAACLDVVLVLEAPSLTRVRLIIKGLDDGAAFAEGHALDPGRAAKEIGRVLTLPQAKAVRLEETVPLPGLKLPKQ